jgi:hypothetical protein
MSILGADISNAYLNAPTTDKVIFQPQHGLLESCQHHSLRRQSLTSPALIIGAEWGYDAGKRGIIVRALLGVESGGCHMQNHLASYLQSLGFTFCLADPDVWLRVTKRYKGEEFFDEYDLLVYTDDLLTVVINLQAILDDVSIFFHLKPETAGHPNIYLGSKVVSKAKLANGIECWCNSSWKYVKKAIKNTEAYIRKSNGKRLCRKMRSLMETNY